MADWRKQFRAFCQKHRRAFGWWGLAGLAIALLAFVLWNASGMKTAAAELAAYAQYRFIQRALVVGILVSLCAALLGVSLVLKRFSMIGDGLSHVGFGALSIATACGYATAEAMPGFLPEGVRVALAGFLKNGISQNTLAFTLIVVILFAFLLLRLSESSAIKGDSAIAILSTGALAMGVLVTSFTSGMNTDVYNYLFGSILAMSATDVFLSVGLSVAVLALFLLFYNKIFAVTFDENFAAATGTPAKAYKMLMAVLAAVTIVVGMRMMGTMLISSLIIFPALTSMRVFRRFRQVVFSAAAVSVACFVAGMALSCLYSFPTGASIVLMNLIVFALFSAVGAIRSKN